MSYEGYVQAICLNRHFYYYYCYADDRRCPVCQRLPDETHSVDETNGEPEPREVIVVTPATVFDLRKKLNDFIEAQTLEEAAKMIAEIEANVTPHIVKHAEYKFGPIIPHKGHSDE